MAKTVVKRYINVDELNREAVERMCSVADAAMKEHGSFVVALSGGSSPHGLYDLVASKYSNRISWNKTHIFFSDERFVKPDSKYSNFGMVKRLLLSKISILPGNIHAVDTSMPTAEESARVYENEIISFFKPKSDAVFDLVLLGVGTDGHTASLFPGDKALSEKQRLVTSIAKPGLPPDVPRITFTLPLINQARNVMFLVSQIDKVKIIEKVIESSNGAASIYPAAKVKPEDSVEWYVRKD